MPPKADATDIGPATTEALRHSIGQVTPVQAGVPRAAKWLGVLGAIPFVFLAIASPLLERPLRRYRAASVALALTCLLCMAPGVSAAEGSALWRALGSEGHVALLRHAIAPGTGDPPNFALGDCGTQRNLSNEGRDQAARIGARFRANGIVAAQVFTSQWCRCLETARLLGLGPVEELPILNSFFRHYERRDSQTQALEDWIAGQDLGGPLVLVTHQVNITALTGVYPASGELVVIRRSENGEISVVGTIETD